MARNRSLVPAGAMLLVLAACGGGGGGGAASPAPPPANRSGTQFIGRLTAPPPPDPPAAIQVCVDATAFCTPVDAGGAFTLSADVGGNVVLVFAGPVFTARLPVANVPPDAIVHLGDVRCDLGSGGCSAPDMRIDASLANAPPRCDGATARPAVLWPPDHSFHTITVDGVVDPDADAIDIEIGEIFQDEPVDEPGDGAGTTAPDGALRPARVRAERSGSGNGRVYHLLFTATDAHGAVCSGSVMVCVPHDRGRGESCLDDGAAFDSRCGPDACDVRPDVQ